MGISEMRTFLNLAILLSGLFCGGRASAMDIPPLNLKLDTQQLLQEENMKLWMVKKVIVDIDYLLKEQGLEIKYCVYKSHRPKKEPISYRGLGACLYENFVDSMTVDSLSGVTYFWPKGPDSQSDPIEIRWRPPHGGFLKIIQQVFEMKLEKPLYWLREQTGSRIVAEELQFEEFIGGEIEIILHEDLKNKQSDEGHSFSPHVKLFKKFKKFQLKLKPMLRQDGLVVYEGRIEAHLKKQDPQINEFDSLESEIKHLSNQHILYFNIETNLNLVQKDRKFFLKVKSDLNSNEMRTLVNSPLAPPTNIGDAE
jgi:hypothetical protein